MCVLKENELPHKKRKKPNVCKLCLAKTQLETYECVIFDKRFVQHAKDDTEVTQGSWKSPYQETILKCKQIHQKQT